MKLLLKLTSLFLLSVILFTACGEAEKKDEKIVLGNENWATSRSLTYLAKIILQNNGFEVEIQNAPIEKVSKEMTEGTVDAFMDAWLPYTHDVYFLGGKKFEDIGKVYHGCRLGIAVPDYMDVDSISQLMENPDLFSNTLYGIRKDAGVMLACHLALEGYKMTPEVKYMEEDELIKTLKSLVEDTSNFATAAWKPHWNIDRYGLKFLVDTTNSFGKVDDIHVMARQGFKTDWPKAADILSAIHFTDEEFSNFLYETKEYQSADEFEKNMRRWIEENKDMVGEWTKNMHSDDH